MSPTFTIEWTLIPSHVPNIYFSIKHTGDWFSKTKMWRSQLDDETGANLCIALFGISDMKITVFTPDNSSDCLRLLWCSLLNIRNWVDQLSAGLPWLTSEIRITLISLQSLPQNQIGSTTGLKRACPHTFDSIWSNINRYFDNEHHLKWFLEIKFCSHLSNRTSELIKLRRTIKDLANYTRVSHRKM